MTDFIVRITEGLIRRGNEIVLSNINIDMLPGEFRYLIGKTGSGKSSLIKALYGEWPIQGKSAQLAGINLINLKKSQIPSLRRKIGIIFQEFFLLRERTVYENLDFVLSATGWKSSKDRAARIAEVLKQTGLGGCGHRMPGELSGGEQQRVAIARALLNKPALILADEPTGNLDPETSDEIISIIRDLARQQGTAVLFATHDYRLIKKFASPVLVCKDQGVSLSAGVPYPY